MPFDPILTDKEYVALGGARCPNCGAANISTTGCSETVQTKHYLEVTCSHCGASWQEVYQLEGYTDLNTGEEEDGP